MLIMISKFITLALIACTWFGLLVATQALSNKIDDDVVLSYDKGATSTDIDVRLRFQGKDLVLSFPPTHGDAMYMASKFCRQRVADEDPDVMKECTRKIGDYLIQEVEKHQQKEFIRQRTKTPFEQSIAWNELEAEADVPTHTGFSPDEHNRVASRTGSSSRLSEHYQLFDNGKLRITLDIGGKHYTADYDMSRDSPIIAARRFCNVHKQELGISIETLDTCVLPVEKHLRTIEREARSKMHTTADFNQRANLAGDASVEFDAFGKSADRTPTRSHLDKFKSNTVPGVDREKTLQDKRDLKESINVRDALMTVSLNVADESFEISFDPHREPLQRVAANFCVKHNKKWGLTVNNIQNDCIKPVVEKLKEALSS